MPCSRFIIYSQTVDLSIATTILGIEPSEQWTKGSRQVIRKRDGSTHVLDLIHKANGWKIRLPHGDEQKDLDDQIRLWLRTLTAKSEALAKIRGLGCEMLLDCWSVGGSDSVSLSPEVLRELADLGVFFDVTFYASAEETAQQGAPDQRP